jgi:hypothetical protein
MVKKIANNAEYIATDLGLLAIARQKLLLEAANLEENNRERADQVKNESDLKYIKGRPE